jgi:hypothetical protein
MKPLSRIIRQSRLRQINRAPADLCRRRSNAIDSEADMMRLRTGNEARAGF